MKLKDVRKNKDPRYFKSQGDVLATTKSGDVSGL